jgi:hypothetical protein
VPVAALVVVETVAVLVMSMYTPMGSKAAKPAPMIVTRVP